MNDLLSIQEAANILGVSTKTLRRWDKADILVPTRTQGNQRRYTKEQIFTFKNRRSLPFAYPSAFTLEQDSLSRHSGEDSERSVEDDSRIPIFQRDSGRAHSSLARMTNVKVGLLVSGLCLIVLILGVIGFSKQGAIGDVILSNFLSSFLGRSTLRPTPESPSAIRDSGRASLARMTGGEVLQASTIDNTLFFNVNIPSKFAEDSDFLKGLSALEIATLSGGLITENQNVDAGTGTLTASNVLYGATAGTGISVGAGQIPTITNTDPGSSQNIFKTIKVGNSSFSSGSNTDTLELSAGSNITLSTDTSNKKVTITGTSATSVTGWTDDGTTVRLTTTSDNVGIGTTSPSTKLDVVGSATISANLGVGGFLTVATDSIGDLTGNGLTVSSGNLLVNLLTTADGTGSTTSNSGLEFQGSGSNQLTLLQGCTDAYVLKWDDTNSEWDCAVDAGGGSAGIINVESNDTAVGSGISTLDFNGDFTLSESPSGEANISLLTNYARLYQTNGSIYPANSTVDLIWGGQATSSAKFAILNVNSGAAGVPTASVSAGAASAGGAYLTATGTLSTTQMQTLTIGGTTTGNVTIDAGVGNITLSDSLTLSGATITGASLTTITGAATAIDFTEFDVSASTGGITINDGGDLGSVSVEGTVLDINSLDFAAGGTITSGGSSDLTLDAAGSNILLSDALNAGGAVAATYNYFASDISGVSTPEGIADLYVQDELEVDGTTRFNNVTYTFPTADGSSNFILTTNGTGTLSWQSIAGVDSANYWRTGSGAISPINDTFDILVGNAATTSAKFAILNVNSGTPTASISANSGNIATYLTGDGTLATTNRQTLTIGNSSTYNTTGNILINPNGTGNVGIGTTTPSSALHVAGQCVTGDSILITEDGKSIRVDEVKKGQKVFTLDQEKGIFVPAQVNELMDMGVKPVFRLTTKSGKSIRTTGNHPYLVSLRGGEDDEAIPTDEIAAPYGLAMTNKPIVEQSPIKDAAWVKVTDLKVGDKIAAAGSAFGGFSAEDNITQGESNEKKRKSNNSEQINLDEIHDNLLPLVLGGKFSSHNIGNNNQGRSNQKQSRSNLSAIKNLIELFSIHIDSLSKATATSNATIASDNDFVKESKSRLMKPGAINTNPNQAAERLPLIPESTRKNDFFTNSTLANDEFNVNQFAWDEIVSIEYTGEEQVWDIEIEGTRNFVANGIVAHNTTFGGGTASTLVIPNVSALTGAGNSIAGSGAGAALISGVSNTLFGLDAGNAIVSAGGNTFIGKDAGRVNTANNNTAVGAGALDVNISGGENVAIGLDTLGANISGSSNTAIGYQALILNTGGSNVGIGAFALAANAGASNNTALGYNAGDSITSGFENIILGSNADASSATAGNEFVAGSATAAITNVYFGEGPLNATPIAYTINGSGGSGTDIAGAALQLAGGKATGNAAGGSIIFQTSDAGASGTTLQSLTTKMTLTAAGNLGIGDTTPDAFLEVLGTSEQLRLTYTDGTVDSRFSVSSTGDLTIDSLGGGTIEQLILSDADVLNIGGSGSTDVAYNVIGDSTSGASSAVGSDDDLYIEGNLELEGTGTLNNVTYTFPSADGSSNFILTTNGTGALSWQAISGVDTANYWRTGSGAISPINDTFDILVGSSATTSAKFAILGVNGTTPTASVSAQDANSAAIYLDPANGALQTVKSRTLTIGGATTGNVTIDAGVGNITLSDDLTLLGTTITASSLATFTTAATLGMASTTTLNCGDCIDFDDIKDTMTVDAATDIDLGGNNLSLDLTTTGVLEIRDIATAYWTFDDDSTVDVVFPAAGQISIDASTTANTTTGGVIDLNVNAGDAAVIAQNIDFIANTGITAAVDEIALNINLTQNDADADMFGLKITQAATAVTIAGTDLVECFICLENQENQAAAVSDAIRITSTAATGGSITTGLDFDTTDITTDIELQNGETIDNNVDGTISMNPTTLTLSGTTTITGTSLTLITGAATAIDFTEFDVSASTGEITINDTGDAGKITIEGTVLDINSLDFVAAGTITAGGTGNIVLGLDSDTVLDVGTGSNLILATDLNFLDAESGNLLMEITDSGTTGTLNVTGRYDINGTAGVTAGSATCVTTTGGIVTGTGSCGLGSGGSVWTLATSTGVLYPINNTVDLLIGATATASAKFAVLNVNSGTPVASVSSGFSGTSSFLTADGTLSTQNRMSLTLGNSSAYNTTGNVLINPNGTGNVGIGTASPVELLTLASAVSAKMRINADTDNVTEADIAEILLTQDGAISTANFGIDSGNSLVIGLNSTTSPNIYFSTRSDGTSFAGASDAKMTILNGGNVGIGTTGPDQKLDILSAAGGTQLRLTSTDGSVYTDFKTDEIGDLTITPSGADASISGTLDVSSYGAFGAEGTIIAERLINAYQSYTGANAAYGLFALRYQTTNSNTNSVTGVLGEGVGFNLGVGNTLTWARGVSGLTGLTGGANPGTVTNAAALYALNSTYGGGTLTNGFGVFVEAQTSATNNAGVLIGEATGTNQSNLVIGQTTIPTGTYSIYNSSADQNYFAGNVGIGDTGPDAFLEVLGTSEQLRLTYTDGTVDSRFSVDSTGDLTIDSLGGGTTEQLILANADVLNIGGSGSTDVAYNVIGDSTSGASALMNSDDDLYIEGNLEVDGELIAPTTGVSGYWQRNSGALSPSNITDDLLLGATSTTSAKFAFLNNAGGTPTASVSANSGNIATYLTGDGTLATTNRQSLTIGNSSTYNTTGNVLINPNGTGFVGIGTSAPTSSLTIDGDIAFVGTQSIVGTGNIVIAPTNNSNQLWSFNDESANSSLEVSALDSTGVVHMDWRVNGGDGDYDARLIRDTGADGNLSLVNRGTGSIILSPNNTSEVTLTSSALSPSTSDGNALGTTSLMWSDLFLASGGVINWNNGDVTLTHASNVLGIEGGSVGITTTSPLGTLDVRPNLTNGGTIAIASVSGATSFAGLLVDNTGVGDLFTASKSGASKFVITNAGNVGIGTASPQTLLHVVNTAVAATSGQEVLRISGATDAGTAGSGPYISFTDTLNNRLGEIRSVTEGGSLVGLAFQTLGGSSQEKVRISAAGNVGIGDTGPDAFLEVLGTTEQLRLTYTDGTVDSRFSVDSTGDLTIDSLGGGTTEQLILANADVLNIGGSGSTDVAYNVIGDSTSGASALMNSDDDLYIEGNLEVDGELIAPATGVSGYWQRNSGALSPSNITDDLLLGATATTSARFAVLNMIGAGVPVATISANSGNNATYLTGDGTLATTNRQTLTIGNSSTYNTTGNILLNPNGTGNVGIGTTNPSTFKLQVAGNIGPDSAPTTGRTLTTVDSSASVGSYPSIYCLSTTDCKIAYKDTTNGQLMMADCDDATCATKTLTVVDTVAADTGDWASIYCVTSTDCKIAYKDTTNGDLKMADCDDATCATKTLTVVDNVAADTGSYVSIYCLSTTDCKIAYQDVTNLDLKMADCDDATCATKTLTVVDSATSASTGAWASIYCVSATDCKISYEDTTNFNLMMADCDDAACATKTLTTVDTADGRHTSIYCLSTTDCKIAYVDDTGSYGDLMMADCDDATCATKTLTTVSFDRVRSVLTERHLSIYCVSTTDCKIVYNDDPRDLLAFVDCDNATCSSRAITLIEERQDDPSTIGQWNSIYCVSSTDCKISFRVSSGSYLSMLDCDTSACVATTGTDLGSVSLYFASVYAGSYFQKESFVGFFDLAEDYSVHDSSIEAGDIVAIAGDQSGASTGETGLIENKPFVEKSVEPYQADVIGVVSTKPGILLSDWQSADTTPKRPVALAGRVPVKVSTENGTVSVGDYLTSSSQPGVAMKATKAGQIIGKALESFSGNGVGKIMVFVNLSWYDPSVYITADGNLSTSLIDDIDIKLTMEDGLLNLEDRSSTQSSTLNPQNTTLDLLSSTVSDLSNRVSLLETKLEASTSALLDEIRQSAVLGTSTSDLLDAKDLDIDTATISGELMVLGRTTVGDLGITGNINAGVLSINGLEGEIYTLAGDLKLQSQGLGGIDILAGKVTIDKKGNIITAGEITAKKVNIDESDSSSKSVGDVVIKAGETNVEVNTTALTSKSHIFATPDKPIAVGTKQKDENTFTITLKESLSEDVRVDWWVVN